MIEVVSVNRPVLVALVKEPLRFGAHAGHPRAVQFPTVNQERSKWWKPPRSCLPRTSIRVEQRRVHVDPSSSRCDQLNPVGPPIGIHDLAQLL